MKKEDNALLKYSGRFVDWQNLQFMYAVVRDPWHRLVSTYAQKVLETDQFKQLCEYNNPVFLEYLK